MFRCLTHYSPYESYPNQDFIEYARFDHVKFRKYRYIYSNRGLLYLIKQQYAFCIACPEGCAMKLCWQKQKLAVYYFNFLLQFITTTKFLCVCLPIIYISCLKITSIFLTSIGRNRCYSTEVHLTKTRWINIGFSNLHKKLVPADERKC